MGEGLNIGGLTKTWSSLSVRQRVTAGGAAAAVVLGLGAMTMLSQRTDDALLMGGLSTQAAGEVSSELDAMGAAYEVRGTGLYVDAAERDRLRLALAAQGLPRSGGAGYELLDELSGFSTTADMFDAAYWRAKEGELSRTIRAIPGVSAARVHLGVGRGSAFSRRGADKTASVTVEAGAGLGADQARSIQMLVALAVAGLDAERVAVIDNARGLLTGPGAEGDADTAEAARAAEIEARLTRLLEARVGVGRARVTAAVELDREATIQTERIVDPDRQVASRLRTEERSREAGAGGPVTVASDLPTGDIGDADDPALRSSITREEVVYVGTEVERTTETRAGALRRLSVAVLLDEPTVETDGVIAPAPRSAAEMEALRQLVANAAGIDEARGDTLALQSLPFEAPPVMDVVAPGFVETQIAPRTVDILQQALLAVVVLVLGLFVVKPLLTGTNREADAAPSGGDAARLPTDAAGLLTVLVEESPDEAAAVLDAWFEEGREAA